MRKLAGTALLMASLVALGACSSGGNKSNASAGSGTGTSSSSVAIPTGGNSGDFCTTLKADVKIFDELNKSDQSPDLQQVLAAVEELAGKAPGPIKDDMNKLVDGFKKTVELSS